MPSLILHPNTALRVEQYIARPTHALMIVGKAGSGKSSLADHLVKKVLEISDDAYGQNMYVKHVHPLDGKSISIDAVRELQRFTSLKVPGRRELSRALVIHSADLMTAEAQNALLKLLEEPPADTVLILTASSDEVLLPTIRSRVRQLNIMTPDLTDLEEYFVSQGYAAKNIERALMLSGGLPGLAVALLTEDNTHPLVDMTQRAKELLQMRVYDRLLLVDSLSKQKEQCLDMLYILGQMSHIALLRNSSPSATLKWQKIMKATYTASELLRQNTQPKLVLTNLMLEL